MKIATFNIQNLFYRNSSLLSEYSKYNMELWTEEFEHLMVHEDRSESDYSRMRDLSVLLGFHKTSYEPYLVMRRKAGNLHVKNCQEILDYKSMALTDWNGWIKLHSIPLNEKSIKNKGRAIVDVNPDILVLQEVEDRASLLDFNNYMLSTDDISGFDQIVHVDGNDKKGRGMGLLVKKGFKILSIRSHANDMDNQGKPLFEKDFQEYEIETPLKKKVWILSAHLIESNSDGRQINSIRKKQVNKIAEVYNEHLSIGENNIAVVGTLNSPSYSGSISAIFEKTNLKDIIKHTSFDVYPDIGSDAIYFRMGAYRKGVNIKQKDYLLLSPTLYEGIKNCGLNRRAMWSSKQPQWNIYDSVKNESHAASEHPMLWVDTNT